MVAESSIYAQFRGELDLRAGVACGGEDGVEEVTGCGGGAGGDRQRERGVAARGGGGGEGSGEGGEYCSERE